MTQSNKTNTKGKAAKYVPNAGSRAQKKQAELAQQQAAASARQQQADAHNDVGLEYDVDPAPPAQCVNHPFIYIRPTMCRVMEKCPLPTAVVIERTFRPRDNQIAPDTARLGSDLPSDDNKRRRGRAGFGAK